MGAESVHIGEFGNVDDAGCSVGSHEESVGGDGDVVGTSDRRQCRRRCGCAVVAVAPIELNAMTPQRTN